LSEGKAENLTKAVNAETENLLIQRRKNIYFHFHVADNAFLSRIHLKPERNSICEKKGESFFKQFQNESRNSTNSSTKEDYIIDNDFLSDKLSVKFEISKKNFRHQNFHCLSKLFVQNE
jgi:hypothetical protein